MTNRRPTSADVARLAGVSRSTVSYILSGNKDQTFPEATRAKVWDAAARLSYTRNAAASALRAGQSNLVLLVVRDIPNGRNLGLAIDRLALLFAQRGMSLADAAVDRGPVTQRHPRAFASPPGPLGLRARPSRGPRSGGRGYSAWGVNAGTRCLERGRADRCNAGPQPCGAGVPHDWPPGCRTP